MNTNEIVKIVSQFSYKLQVHISREFDMRA